MFLSANNTAEFSKELGGEFEIFCDDVPENNEWNIQGGIFINENEEL